MILRRLKNKQGLLLIMAVLLIAFGSCRKDEFDEPPSNGVDPGLTVNMKLDSLKKKYLPQMSANQIVTITEDWVIKGLVVADDKSGNLYKTIIIDDGSAGIAIRIDISNYNTTYPVGRQVYVKLKGLFMGTYADLVQLGGYIDSTSGSSPSVEAIPASLVTNHFVAGTWGNPVVPYTVTIAELNNTYKWQNRLVKINDLQFQPSDTAETWADNVNLGSVNRYLEDCYFNDLIVRTSGYCNFAAQLTPKGSGSFVGVFSVYNSDKQMILRDPSDLSMNNARFIPGTCPPPPPPPTGYSDISAVRAAYLSGNSVCDDVFIQGTVISDVTSTNINGRNLYIQDNSGGIVVRFDANHSFQLGDSLKIICAGQTLSEFNGLLQIGGTSPNVPVSFATVLASGKTVTPRITTIAQLKANLTGTNDPWESTLVKLQNVTFIGGGTYAGSKLITDGVDTITIFTATGASFSGSNVPTTTVSVTGILSDYSFASAPNTRQQLVLRGTNDVQ